LSEVLIDTNILVYGHDPRDLAKQKRSQTVLDQLIRAGSAVLSIQCLNEFYRAVRWRIPERVTATQALREVDRFARNCRVLPITATAALDGMRACDQYSMSFWDSLIWAVAKEGGIPYMLTEDFDDGTSVEGVRFVEPFTPSFDLSSLAR
jgi:predicted nucleic acid-binding protein